MTDTKELDNEEESSGETYKRLGIDAMLWAEEIIKLYPELPLDNLHSWCCNMIMAGYDGGIRQLTITQQKLVVAVEALGEICGRGGYMPTTDFREQTRIMQRIAKAALNTIRAKDADQHQNTKTGTETTEMMPNDTIRGK